MEHCFFEYKYNAALIILALLYLIMKINWRFISFLNLLLIFYLSFFIIPGNKDIPSSIPHLDKIGHFILYGFQSASFRMALKGQQIKYSSLKIFIFCFLFGLIIEYLQPILTNNRVFDLFDIVANMMGAFLSLTILNFLVKKK